MTRAEDNSAELLAPAADATAELPGPERAPKSPRMISVALAASLCAAVLAIVLFAWIAHEMREGDTTRFDLTIRTWVHQQASPGLTRAMVMISALGANMLLAIFMLAVAIFLLVHWRRAAMWLLISIAGALVLDLTLKHAFHRPRPTPFFGSLPHSYSFPSGHALFSFCFYGVLAGVLTARMRSPRLRAIVWIVAAALVVAIGLSRIYLGVHYPSDALAGYLAAAVWVSTIVALDRARKRRRVRAEAGKQAADGLPD